MPRIRVIGLMLGLCVYSTVCAQDQGSEESESYLNGYTAGRALSGYYEESEKEAFIRGLLKGMDETAPTKTNNVTLRDAKVSWFNDIGRSKKERASYAAGYLNGDAYQSPESLYSVYNYVQGLLDSIQSSGLRYVDKLHGTKLITDYQRGQFYKKKRSVAEAMKLNERAGEAFLQANALEPGITQTASGLQFKVISKGSGRKPNPEDSVVVSLLGQKIDGSIFYDSEIQKEGRPLSIKVNQALNGWQEALSHMSSGAEWELFLPSHLAYGNAGWQDRVQGGETLIYRMKLIDVIPAK